MNIYEVINALKALEINQKQIAEVHLRENPYLFHLV